MTMKAGAAAVVVKGNSCRFAHDLPKKECYDFRNGKCKRGDDCKFQHRRNSRSPLQRPAASYERSPSPKAKREKTPMRAAKKAELIDERFGGVQDEAILA